MHAGESLIVASPAPDTAEFTLVQPRSVSGRTGRRLLLGALQRIAPRADPAALDRLLDRPGNRDELFVAAVDGNSVLASAFALPGPGRTAQLVAGRPRNLREVVALATVLRAITTALRPDEAAIAQTLLDVPLDHDPPDPPAAAVAGVPDVADVADVADVPDVPDVPDVRAPTRRPDPSGSAALEVAPSLRAGASERDLLDHADPLERAFLEAGFERLAILDYLARPLRRGERPEPPPAPPHVTLEPWHRNDAEILGVLESTYLETRDCPRLCGMRRTEDILAGHLAAGRHEPRLWTILRVDSIASGVVLVSPSHAGLELELVYLGLAPAARGRGLARLLLDHALHQASARRERRMCLAVDRSNPVAVALYRAAGFARVASRRALIRRVDAAQPGA